MHLCRWLPNYVKAYLKHLRPDYTGGEILAKNERAEYQPSTIYWVALRLPIL
jgi:hypothetical protein